MQSAVELLTTYAWAFIIVAIFVSVMFVLSSSKQITTYAPSSCYIEPSLPCRELVFMSNSLGSRLTLVFSNNLGTSMFFPPNALTVRSASSTVHNYTGQCLPVTAASGALVVCNVSAAALKVGTGTQMNFVFTLTYQLCSGSTCDPSKYNTTGTSVAVAAPFRPLLANVIILTNPTTGNVVVSGIQYPNNAVLSWIYGLNYTIFAVPPSGYTFNTWSVTSGIMVANTLKQSTSAITTNSGSLQAIFSQTTSTTTTSTTSVSTTSTSTTTISLTFGVISPSSPQLDLNQNVILTGSWTSGGTPPYTLKWYSGQYASCTQDTNQINPPYTMQQSQTSNSLSVNPIVSTYYCASLTDSYGVVATSSSPAHVIVSSAPLTAGPLTETYIAIDSGTSSTLTAQPSGTQPYTYNWYAAAGTTPPPCDSANAISGATQTTSNTYSASPTATTSYAYSVTDSAYSPVTQCFSAGNTITVGQAFLSTAWTASNSVIDVGQYQTLNAVVSGGTVGSGYIYNFQVYNSNGGVTSSAIYTSPSISNTFTFQQTAASDSYTAGLTVNDILGSQVQNTLSYAVNPALVVQPLTANVALPSTQYVGTNVLFTSSWSGGSCREAATLSTT